MKKYIIGTPNVVSAALAALSFAESVRDVAGQAPANAVSPVSRVGKTFRVDPSALKIGTKSHVKKADADNDPLPPPKFEIKQVEVDGEQLFECTAIVYGRPRIKDKDQKDAKKNYQLTGQITRQLSLASTITGRPIMIAGDEGERERMIIDVPWVDPDTKEETTLQFAMIGTAHFYGKLLGEVNYREPANQNG